MLDVEFGYQYQGSNWHAGANFYYMGYDNQLVQTGQESEIGEALTTNVKDSYRMGVELSAGWAPLSWLSFEGNAALSKNKIKDFDEYVEDWGSNTGTRVNHYDNSTLSFSPSAILNGFVDFHYAGSQLHGIPTSSAASTWTTQRARIVHFHATLRATSASTTPVL